MFRFHHYFAAILIFSAIGIVQAADPADNIIKNSLSDIVRFEQQAQGLTAARRSNVRRLLKLMTITRDRLDSSANQDHASWKEADQRLSGLRSQLKNLIEPATATTPQKVPSQSGTVGGQTTQPAQAKGRNSAAQQPDVRPLVSGERVRVKKLARDLANVRDNIVTEGPSHLQAQQNLAQLKKRFDQFSAAIKRYPQIDDPDVQKARQEYQALSEAATAEVARAKAQLAQLGDVQQRLAKIEAALRGAPLPGVLDAPFTRAQADAWVAAGRKLHPVAQGAKKEIEQIAPIAYLPFTTGTPPHDAYDHTDLDRLYGFADSQLKDLGRQLEGMTVSLDRGIEDIRTSLAATNADRDPTNPSDLWVYLQEGMRDEMHKRLDEKRARVTSGIQFYESLGREPPAAHRQMLTAIEDAGTKFDQDRATALDTSKLPEAASKSSELLDVARTTLANPSYSIDNHERLVINADLASHETETSEIDIDKVDVTLGGDLKLSGTQTTWTYKWDQFQVSTVERQPDGIYYIWHTTLKNYSSGGPNTPLNKWIVAGRIKGNEILKENIDK
ncbi:hypothetical protein [Pelagibius sp. Alg239-R121]|uniref:hypothetical protein n=1 Tax=Pelagibius sp. Alg239-R121 TaxID=2993448 RepID=UPI0024A68DE7|nr:hypothetical protein [Pelagibius sp. Alg239-R121]